MLPVAAVLPELLAALEANNCAVLIAPPGAGKTTGVPPALLDAPWRAGRKIVVVEPRRRAARAAAARSPPCWSRMTRPTPRLRGAGWSNLLECDVSWIAAPTRTSRQANPVL